MTRGGGVALAVLFASRVAAADPVAIRGALARGAYDEVERLGLAARGGDRAVAQVLMAEGRLATGRYELARALLTPLVRGPEGVRALTVLGELEWATGRPEEARAAWEAAIARAPGRPSDLARARLLRVLAVRASREVLREVANPLIDAYNDAAPRAAGPRGVLGDANFLTAVAEATWALGALRNAATALNEALAVAPSHGEANLTQAALMMTTEDYAPAGEAVTAVLAAQPRHPEALLLRARLRLTSNHDLTRAAADLDALLAINPRHAAGLAVRGMVALRDDDVAGAVQHFAASERVNPRGLDLAIGRALLAFHRNDRDALAAALAACRREAPRSAAVEEALGDFADWEHRYDEAATLMREALSLPVFAGDPRLASRVNALYGFNRLRVGDEAGGVAALRLSFAANRYNVRASNLLNFYEQTLPAGYVVDTVGPFRVRYHHDEAPVLRRYVPAMLGAAYDEMVARYRFTPEGPLSIELYAREEDFAVRTAGEPEIGVQGVCFGRVVTALSPRAGAFNWSQIVWHELAHVFAIQRSRSRVPRWFTEGLSEWEAFHGHPRWAREEDPALWAALRGQRLPTVASFNRAFTHARSGRAMLVAYYAASQLMAFMIAQYGFERVASALPRFAEGASTAEALEASLGVSVDALDAAFRRDLEARLGPRYRAHFDPDLERFASIEPFARAAEASPRVAEARAELAAARFTHGERDAARSELDAALALDATQPLARYLRALMGAQGEAPREALADLEALFAQGLDGPALRSLEARVASRLGDRPRARRALERLTALDPTQGDAWWSLAEALDPAAMPRERLAALAEVVRRDQHHREALGALIEGLSEARRWPEVAELQTPLIELDPENLGLTLRVAHALAQSQRRDDSLRMYETALAMAPDDAAAIRARMAELRAGQNPTAPLAAPAPASRR